METERSVLTEGERLDWLRLIRSENIGPKTFFSLLGHFGSVEAALLGVPGLAARGGRKRPIRLAAEENAGAEVEALGRLGCWRTNSLATLMMVVARWCRDLTSQFADWNCSVMYFFSFFERVWPLTLV